jgi:endonuclease III
MLKGCVRYLKTEDAQQMNPAKVADALVKRGKALFQAPLDSVAFTKNPKADALLNDLRRYPHAFVLSCILDRQTKAERAWMIPYAIAEKIGGFEFNKLESLSYQELFGLMTTPVPLHRFPEQMSKNVFAAIERISQVYGGNASKIWADTPPSAEVVYRFLLFKGVGLKIASMATNMLVRHFKVPLAEYYSVDVAADVHTQRVFYRLGLTDDIDSIEQVIYRARGLSPDFPGLMDMPCWEIGRTWCHPKNPECGSCYMNDLCAHRINGS